MAETRAVAPSSTQLPSNISVEHPAHQAIDDNDAAITMANIPTEMGTVLGPRAIAAIEVIPKVDNDNNNTPTPMYQDNYGRETCNVEEDSNQQENGELAFLKEELAKIKTQIRAFTDHDDRPQIAHRSSPSESGSDRSSAEMVEMCALQQSSTVWQYKERSQSQYVNLLQLYGSNNYADSIENATRRAGRKVGRMKRRLGRAEGVLEGMESLRRELLRLREQELGKAENDDTDLNRAHQDIVPEGGDGGWNSDGEVINPAGLSCVTIPKLNWVDWEEFKPGHVEGISQFAIDILVGEPRCESFKERLWHKTRLERGRANGANAPGWLPGQAPLPDRIRIRSHPILEGLFGVIKRDLNIKEMMDHETGDWPVVMMKPFRSLVYHEFGLRNYLRRLEERLADTTDVDEGGGGGVKSDESSHINSSTSRQVEELEESQEEHASARRTVDRVAIQEAADHIGCLIDFIDKEIEPKRRYIASSHCHQVRFDEIWYLFQPGDEVVDQELRQAYRVIRVFTPDRYCDIQSYYSGQLRDEIAGGGGRHSQAVRMLCIYIGFDGKVIGPVKQEFVIYPFTGLRSVISLEVYPVRFAAAAAQAGNQDLAIFRNTLILRGKMFLEAARVKHLHYSGLTLCDKDEVDSEVVVDFEEACASKMWNDLRPDIQSLVVIGHDRSPRDTGDWECRNQCCRDEPSIYTDGYLEQKRFDDYLAALIPKDSSKATPITMDPRRVPDEEYVFPLTDEDYLIMSNCVFGFVLRNRKWAELDPNCLGPVRSMRKVAGEGQGNSAAKKPQQSQAIESGQAFHQLVLPKGHKDIILSLIAQHYRDKESSAGETEQVDIIRGKGKGLIVLLHGAPGVGKTSTAEGVAELFGKPLFQITCGDLGTTASEVEENLSTHFALASKWGCILLLDEADVFLATRTPQDFKRNGMVSVFLRVLEYYSGILFLTTNRLGDLDEAFASRIHIGLHYPQLDLESTRAVFELNLKLINDRFAIKGREIAIDSSAILHFAAKYWTDHPDMRWNGRQIRNACQTALALAEFTAQGGSHLQVLDAGAKISLGLDQLNVVAKAYLEFTTYLDDIFDTNAERRAKQMRIRARVLEKHDHHSKTPVPTSLPPRDVTGIDEATKRVTGQPPIQAAASSSTGVPGVPYPLPHYTQPPAPGFQGTQMPIYPPTTALHRGFGQQPPVGNIPPQYPYHPNYGQAPQNVQYHPPEHAASGTAYAQQQPQAHQVWNTQSPQGWPAPGIPQGQTPYPQASTQQTYGITPPGLPPSGPGAPTTPGGPDSNQPGN